VIVKTGGVAQQWRVSNIKIATGTLVTIKFENSEMAVDESWFVLDANSDCLFLQRLGFFGDMGFSGENNKVLPSSFSKRRGLLTGLLAVLG